jgi:hypothetical protein
MELESFADYPKLLRTLLLSLLTQELIVTYKKTRMS